jgi:hypothetical protein
MILLNFLGPNEVKFEPGSILKLIQLQRLESNQNVYLNLPELSSSKQAKAFRITSSGSVPFNFSPNIVRNIVKLIGPGASAIISSK